jgi:hypothetical protein
MARGYKRYAGTQFTGVTRDNTIAAKAKGDHLNSSERNRLLKMTGVEDDPTLPHDPRVWIGLAPPGESVIDHYDE